MEMQWELVNAGFVSEIESTYNITAISSQMMVMSNFGPDIDEPGNHGSIVTFGNVEPVSEPWINSFTYDCTSTSEPK
jgi:hypothetical protein